MLDKEVRIVDPRVISRDNSDLDPTERVAVERSQLIISAHESSLADSQPVLLAALLARFVSDCLFYTYLPINKRKQKILNCFSPDIAIGFHSGILYHSELAVTRVTQCYEQFHPVGIGFEWLIGAFPISSLEHVRKSLSQGALADMNSDVLREYIEFGVYFNDERGWISIHCNREDLYDDFIEFASTIGRD
ncbi:MAG: hypothetical protein J7J98_04130 [candidate division Zixibacteria bacterium]|nr:hypothetical protein [candidate division Zixibacteria bacterium]